MMLYKLPSLLALLAAVAEFSSASKHNPPTLAITSPKLTSKWFEGSDFVQIIEMWINNTGSTNWLTSADTLSVTATSDSFFLVSSASLARLRPGDAAIVQIGVKNHPKVAAGTTCTGTVIATWGTQYGSAQMTNTSLSGPCGLGNYSASSASLANHLTPDWFDEMKYGIFSHWGIYSAPAYGNTGANENYAEWYWYRMHYPSDKTQTYEYHEQTYGTSFNYDDFFSNFTTDKFDARSWVQLVADAGAQYYVPVTKHHDGFALFNFSTSISRRSSIHYGPNRRDFIGELLAAAKEFQPQLRRGTYFSLPEWYNPAYAKYQDGSNFPGGPPVNPYTGEVIPYTGFVNVSDFILDIQVPQMNTLLYDYETEILWCDIGGANNSTIVVSNWINWARDRGRQVTYNSRCGLHGDYDTPEYTTNQATVARKWESNRGMDPFSYGYNYQTPDSAYLTPVQIVNSLVDIVSKNGNFLLDIGPKNDGTIPDIMQTNLRAAGTWVKAHAESIFKTRYWSRTPGLGNFRYTTTPTAFYIHLLAQPNSTVLIPDPVPFLSNDKVTVVGGKMNGAEVPLTDNGNATYTLEVSSDIADSDQYVWTFKISYSSHV